MPDAQDRLAEIEQRYDTDYYVLFPTGQADMRWLIEEVKRLRTSLQQSTACSQHEWFSGGCPCDCHAVHSQQDPAGPLQFAQFKMGTGRGVGGRED